ncbi:MAG: hypothetical protein A4E55_01219 [Pelotomaculum sp. PtaU1.Bin035]|nr:MAG: hypothetical protein A4E55_01219 [Pelotomaculum sp. PtaU1.Bin035]
MPRMAQAISMLLLPVVLPGVFLSMYVLARAPKSLPWVSSSFRRSITVPGVPSFRMVLWPRASVMVRVVRESSLNPEPSGKFSSAWPPGPVFMIVPSSQAAGPVISWGSRPGLAMVVLPFMGMRAPVSVVLFRPGSMFSMVARPLANWARVAWTWGAKLFFWAIVNRPACRAMAIWFLAQYAGSMSVIVSVSGVSIGRGSFVSRSRRTQASARLTGASGLNVPSG